MKKKVLSLMLVGALASSLLFTACGGSTNKEEAKDKETTASSEVSPATENDADKTATSESDTEEATTAAVAANDESWNKVQSAGKFIMGLDDSFPPMGFRDENNNITGYDVDLAKEVCSRLGIELELLPIDWAMKENELNSGNIDAIWNGYSFTPERREKTNLSKPYLSNDQVVVVMASSGLDSLAALAGKTLAVQEMSSAQDALEASPELKASLGEVVSFKDNVTAFLDMESGNSDALLLDKVVGEYYVSQKNPEDYFIIGESLSPETYHIGFRKNDEALKTKIEDTLDSMKEDGKLAEITTKWFGSDTSVYQSGIAFPQQ